MKSIRSNQVNYKMYVFCGKSMNPEKSRISHLAMQAS